MLTSPNLMRKGLSFFVSLNKFWLVNMYELFNVHVNKANENTYSPMVTLRIIKGTIFYATAAFLMAPSVKRSLIFDWFCDCNVYFKRWLEFHRILVKPNEWLKHRYISYYLLCKVNEIMIALKILIIALNCWITGSTSTEI